MHKLYLDSCSTYHSSFTRWMLGNVHQVSTVLKGNYNAVVSSSYEIRFFGLWEFWLNEQVISKLLSIPKLENYGYVIDYNTNRDWVVTIPEGKTPFSRKMSVCARECHTWIFMATTMPLL